MEEQSTTPAPVEKPPAPVEKPPAPVEKPPAPVEKPPAPAGQPSKAGGGGVDDHKLMGIIGYVVPLLFFIPLITDAKNNTFARYHANQQLLLLLFWVIGQLVASLTMVILIGALLYPLVCIAGVIYMIMGIVRVVNGEMKPLPVIGKWELIK